MSGNEKGKGSVVPNVIRQRNANQNTFARSPSLGFSSLPHFDSDDEPLPARKARLAKVKRKRRSRRDIDDEDYEPDSSPQNTPPPDTRTSTTPDTGEGYASPPPPAPASSQDTSVGEPPARTEPHGFIGAHKRRRANPRVQYVDDPDAPIDPTAYTIGAKKKITEFLAGSSSDIALGRKSAIGPKDKIGSRLMFVRPPTGAGGNLQLFNERTKDFRAPDVRKAPLSTFQADIRRAPASAPGEAHFTNSFEDAGAEPQDYDDGWDARTGHTKAGISGVDMSQLLQKAAQAELPEFEDDVEEEETSAGKDTAKSDSLTATDIFGKPSGPLSAGYGGAWRRTNYATASSYGPPVNIKLSSFPKAKEIEPSLATFSLVFQDFTLPLILKDIKSNQQGPPLHLDAFLKDNVVIDVGAAYGHELLYFLLSTWSPTGSSARVKENDSDPAIKAVLRGLITWLSTKETFILSNIPEKPTLFLAFFSSRSKELGPAWKVSEQLLCLSDTLLVALISRP